MRADMRADMRAEKRAGMRAGMRADWRGRRMAAVVVACALAAAAGVPTACRGPRDGASATPGDARADSTLARQLFARADSIDAWAAAHPRGERRFGQVRGRAGAVPLGDGPVPDSLDLEAEEHLLADERGTALRFATEPVSPSGDWSGRFTHYFDTAGRTVVYERRVSTFAGGCTEVLRLLERRALAPDGRTVGRVLRLRDRDDRAVADSARCDLDAVPDDTVFGSYAALARAHAIAP